ncbi:hypothetical protein BSLG_009200 [Batrachochytrium salamandrivorans]|nr:hypothetical protein BSLG_009200 [Batrachochytrium salamandrivorans]
MTGWHFVRRGNTTSSVDPPNSNTHSPLSVLSTHRKPLDHTFPSLSSAKISSNSAWRRFLALSAEIYIAHSSPSAQSTSLNNTTHNIDQSVIAELLKIFQVLVGASTHDRIDRMRLSSLVKMLDYYQIAHPKQQLPAVLGTPLASSIDLYPASFIKPQARSSNLSPKLPTNRKIDRHIVDAAVAHRVKELSALGDASASALFSLLYKHITQDSISIATEILRNMHAIGVHPDASTLELISEYLESENSRNVTPTDLSTLRTCVDNFHPDSNSHSPRIGPTLALLETYCSSAATFTKAKRLFESIPFSEYNDISSTLICHRLFIDALVFHKKDLSSAEKVFDSLVHQHYIVPDRPTSTSMLHAYVALGNIDQVYTFYNNRLRNEVRRDERIYALLIRAHAMVGDSSGAMSLMDIASTAGVVPTIGILTSILVAFVRSTDTVSMDAAELFYRNHILGKHHHGAKVFNILIYGYAQRQFLQPMMEWFEQLLDHGCRPTSFTYNTLKFALFSPRSEATHSMQVNFDANFEKKTGLNIEQLRTIHSDTIELNFRLRKYGAFDGTEWIEKTLGEHNRIPTIETYTVLMASHFRENNLSAALQVYSTLLMLKLKPDAHVYHQLIVASLRTLDNRIPDAFDLFEDMISLKLLPLDSTLLLLVSDCIYHKRHDHLDKIVSVSILGRLVPYPESFYTLLFRLLVASTEWPPATQTVCVVLRDWLSRGRDPQGAMITLIANEAISHNNIHALFQVAHTLVQCRIPLIHASGAFLFKSMYTLLVNVLSQQMPDQARRERAAVLGRYIMPPRNPAVAPPLADHLLQIFADYIVYAVTSSSAMCVNDIEACLRYLALHQQPLAILQLWTLMSTSKATLGSDSFYYNSQYQSMRVQIFSIVLEALGIVVGDQDLTRYMWTSVWSKQLNPQPGTTSQNPTPPLDGTYTAFIPTENNVWSFVRVLFHWGCIYEAVDLATTGIDTSRIIPTGMLFKLVLQWLQDNHLKVFEQRYLKFWKLKRPEWVA